MSKFYFEFVIKSKTDFNVAGLQDKFGINATKLVSLKDSKGSEANKSAKFFYKTKEYEDDFADELFENFVLKAKEKLVGIKEILEENDGKMSFCIVYTETEESPKACLSSEVISALAEMGAYFETDII